MCAGWLQRVLITGDVFGSRLNVPSRGLGMMVTLHKTERFRPNRTDSSVMLQIRLSKQIVLYKMVFVVFLILFCSISLREIEKDRLMC